MGALEDRQAAERLAWHLDSREDRAARVVVKLTEGGTLREIAIGRATYRAPFDRFDCRIEPWKLHEYRG